jgi:hypothetical protein
MFRIYEDIQFIENITIDRSDLSKTPGIGTTIYPIDDDPIIKDMMAQIRSEFLSNTSLERKCRISKWVFIKFANIFPNRGNDYKKKSIIGFRYIDGNIYHPVGDFKVINRYQKIDTISNIKNEGKVKSFLRSLFITDPIIDVNKLSDTNYFIDELTNKL